MRGMAIVLCAAALVGNGGRLSAQAAPAKSSPIMIKTGPTEPAKPRPLLPDSFAGWEATGPVKTVTDVSEAGGAHAAALKEYEFASAMFGDYKRGHRHVEHPCVELQESDWSLRRLLLLPAERLAEGGHRHRRHFKQQPRAVLEGQHGGGRDFFAHRARCRRRDARDGQASSRCRREPGADAADPGNPAAGLARSARPRIMPRGPRAMRAAAACCRRSWWASIAARRP